MPVLFTCPKGHRWEGTSADAADNVCPLCGTTPHRPAVTPAELDSAGSTVPAPAPPEPVPTFKSALPRLPDLDVREVLGQGGMGVVYKAWQPSHRRWVAVKVIRKDRQANPELVRRFHREA